ncbi:hypothetical protein GX51_07141 [Blastomyces parvus]|uniref:HNH nuclease domain-containing protein n=1 Tax=Blastomyces parvus TaxID=2060905 RepID=A0A2B7WMK5_9EURO|nr:hypothetical protein GX51_07141 [Blastomyces parvus]
MEQPVLDLSAAPLTTDELDQADDIFRKLIDHCEPLQSKIPYKKVTLVRLTYEHCRSKHTFLRQIFTYLDAEDQNSQDPPPTFEHGLLKYSTFNSEAAPAKKGEVEHVIDSFAEISLIIFSCQEQRRHSQPQLLCQLLQENVAGTPARLSTLRRDCLIRDHNRCMATRLFNMTEAAGRFEQTRDTTSDLKDDDGQPLIFERSQLAQLEVAHIIPHSIMSATTVDGQLQVSKSKKTALSILNMFDPGVIHLIEGPNIDRPRNALTLAIEAHRYFGNFELFFDAMDDDGASTDLKHTYKIHSPKDSATVLLNLPVTRTLLLSPNHTIDPPSSQLLALHRAIAIILHLSAAGEYINRIIRDSEQLWVRNDGSSELGQLVSLRLGGWLDGVAT